MNLFFSHQPGSRKSSAVEEAYQKHQENSIRRVAMFTNGVDPDEAGKKRKPRKPRY